ncbi:anti-sigma B factor antagonist [Amycolatopsis arida]|uniref:Anti-sigma factor antagonist n=1 Tax=Amycolatopsis arida TaxID=587909 RepID=A0A1I5LU60_9PSEU|nr:STAS domain-containing protein [Amycolatopsis arida]TDX93846.1 anti-sigma B factor antagonist [Amycolatopsis arida]SFP00772.1 anti-sigma B factor antagonist [Amycolatopsis arida]
MIEPSEIDVGPAQRDGDRLLLKVTGEIDHSTATALHDRVLGSVEPDVRHLVLDFSAVTFCDSSGMSALLGIWRRLHGQSGGVSIAAAPANVVRALRMGGLDEHLPTHPDVTEALRTP